MSPEEAGLGERQDLLYIDLHLVHEVTSPQAFEGLRLADRKVRRPDLTLATVDHNVPTIGRDQPNPDPLSAKQLDVMRENARDFGVALYDMFDIRQGIVHIIGPEQGFTQPGMTIVCGDSHTSTHGAFGALAFGIGTSEVEHVLATQTLRQTRPKTMAVEVNGRLGPGVTAKDVILAIINEIGVHGGIGHVIEYRGDVIRELSMEGRMTICNMSIEAGARAGLIAPDETTFLYMKGRPQVPSGDAWDEALERWRALPTDPDAVFDRVVELDGNRIMPHVTWGTNPAQSVTVDGRVPDPEHVPEDQKESVRRALAYMALTPGTPISEITIDRVFLGSCTNGRIEDLRAAAAVIAGKQVAPGVKAMVVPGSGLVKRQAEEEGLADIFMTAGFEWRDAGCSMCLGMNPDILQPGERCASTSNRNFEGRQGPGGRTHLVSPEMAGRGCHRRAFRRRPRGEAMRQMPVVTGRAIPLRRANVDTDQIIPAKHLKRIERTGYGPFAFEAWRQDPDFILNDPAYKGAKIMITGPNFGSGSSREHAVWALDGLGIEALIGASFADIFKSNCFQGGILTVELPETDVDYLMSLCESNPKTEIVIDLPAEEVRLGDGSWTRRFEIDPFRKYRLHRGLDDISMTLEYEPDITAFEQSTGRTPAIQ